MKRFLSIFGIVAGALGWIAVTACNQQTIQTPLRSFDRPSDVSLSCVQLNSAANGYEVRPFSSCDFTSPAASAGSDMGLSTSPVLGPNPPTPFLLALVTQSARGEVAFVDTAQARQIDADPQKPGFGFVPVGRLPEHIRTSADGCYAITANVDSCDFARIDVAQVINKSLPLQPNADLGADDPGRDVTSAVIRFRATLPSGRELWARPSWIEMAPDSQKASSAQCMDNGTQRAWVAFPGCQLVAKMRFTKIEKQGVKTWRGELEEAVRVTATATTVVTDLETISCPVECSGAPQDGGVPAAGASDGAAPQGIAIDATDANGLSRLVISNRNGRRIDIIPVYGGKPDDPKAPPVDHYKTLGAIHSVSLDLPAGGDFDPAAGKRTLGVSLVRISPRSPAGKFVYAVASDNSVRVIDLDRELECETNIDPRWKDDKIDLQQTPRTGLYGPDLQKPVSPLVRARELGCLALHDPLRPAPRRSALTRSPGIPLAAGQLVTDIAFVHVDQPPRNTDVNTLPPIAGPGLLVGDFAWLITSDGRASVVNIVDDCPAPNQPNKTASGNYEPSCSNANLSWSIPQTQAQLGHPEALLFERLSHRIRSGHPRFVAPASPSDPTGQPRVADENSPYVVSVPPTALPDGGVVDGGLSATLPFLYQEDVPPALVDLTQPNADPITKRVVRFPDPMVVRNENWYAIWEGTIPGSERPYGATIVDENGKGLLTDQGGNWCGRGITAGDKLIIKGCTVDSDCDQSIVDIKITGMPTTQGRMQCVHDPAAPVDVPTGLCLPINPTNPVDDWVARCGQLLRSQRKYRIARAVQQSGGDQLELAEIYEPEFPEETNTCTSDADCRGVSVLSASGTVTATACRADSDAAHTMRCLLPCKDAKDNVCGAGFVCAASQATDRPGELRCMRAPIEPKLWDLCYREAQDYEVHVGNAFLVYGTASGYVAYQEQNAANECFVPTLLEDEFERLRQARVPLSPPLACPASMASPLDSLDPSLHTNVCQFNGISGFQVVHFENPVMNIALQIRKQGINNRVIVPPAQTQILWTVVGGGNPLTAPLGVEIQAQQPRYAVVAPDRQTVYVIDEGKSPSASGLRGQLLRLYSTTQQVDSLFRVR